MDMRHCIPFTAAFLLLTGCEQDQGERTKSVAADPWSDEAEVLFQEAEALKYTLQQQQLESARLQEQGLDGQPPSPR